jgi:hypothetical protein
MLAQCVRYLARAAIEQQNRNIHGLNACTRGGIPRAAVTVAAGPILPEAHPN